MHEVLDPNLHAALIKVRAAWKFRIKRSSPVVQPRGDKLARSPGMMGLVEEQMKNEQHRKDITKGLLCP